MKAKGLVSIGDALDKVAITPPPPAPPEKPTTPKPIKSKVVSNPVRTPINRQAARIIAKPPWWAKLDAALDAPTGPPPTLSWEELKAARRENAQLSNEIGKLRNRLADMQCNGIRTATECVELKQQNQRLKQELAQATKELRMALDL